MDIRQGNTIRFVITFKPSEQITATSWDDIDNIIAYVYVPGCTADSQIVKFSKTTKVGYNTLYKLDSTHLLGAITSQQSKLMLGELNIEVYVKDTLLSDIPEEIGINGNEIGICIIESLIKSEVV